MNRIRIPLKLSVWLLITALLLSFLPTAVSAQTVITHVDINMNGLHFSFNPDYTEGQIDTQVRQNVSVDPDKPYVINMNPANTGLLKHDGLNFWGVGNGYSHMNPASTYYFHYLLETKSADFVFTDKTTATVPFHPTHLIDFRSSNPRELRVYVKAPAVSPTSKATYVITYNGNGGGLGGQPDNLAVGGIPMKLPTVRYSAPAGHVFKAWAIGWFDGPQVQPHEAYTFTANTTVFAIWQSVATPTVAPPPPPPPIPEPTPMPTPIPTPLPTPEQSDPVDPPADELPETGEDTALATWGAILIITGVVIVGTVLLFRHMISRGSDGA